jgi:hypothetical protein
LCIRWLRCLRSSASVPGIRAERLIRALAELPSEVYGVSVEAISDHAALRADAMLLRNDKA